MIFSGALAGLGAFLFALSRQDSWLRRRTLLGAVLIAAFGMMNLLLASRHKSILELAWMRGGTAESPIYEKWNSFSRVIVAGDPDISHQPETWGLSPAYRVHALVRQLSVLIDAGAFALAEIPFTPRKPGACSSSA